MLGSKRYLRSTSSGACYAGSTTNTALKPASINSSSISVLISRMRNDSPDPIENVSPTVQFGTAVTKPGGIEDLSLRVD